MTDKIRALRVVHCRWCMVPTRIVWRNGGWYHADGRRRAHGAAEPPLDYPGRRRR